MDEDDAFDELSYLSVWVCTKRRSFPGRGIDYFLASTKGLIPTRSSVHLRYFSIIYILVMNFFKSIQTSVNSIPNMGKNNQPARNNDYIVELIRSCTYPDE